MNNLLFSSSAFLKSFSASFPFKVQGYTVRLISMVQRLWSGRKKKEISGRKMGTDCKAAILSPFTIMIINVKTAIRRWGGKTKCQEQMSLPLCIHPLYDQPVCDTYNAIRIYIWINPTSNAFTKQTSARVSHYYILHAHGNVMVMTSTSAAWQSNAVN